MEIVDVDSRVPKMFLIATVNYCEQESLFEHDLRSYQENLLKQSS